MIKFEFELSDIDAENLFNILHHDRMRLLTKYYELKADGVAMRRELNWYAERIRYLDELAATIFGKDVVYTEL